MKRVRRCRKKGQQEGRDEVGGLIQVARALGAKGTAEKTPSFLNRQEHHWLGTLSKLSTSREAKT